MLTWLSPDDPPERFPSPAAALREPAGLLAAGGDLCAARLLAAYRQGIFPWYSPGEPILWWCPDPREVLWPGEFRCARSLRRLLDTQHFEWRQDSDFEAVISACAAPRRRGGGTWITPEMRAAYLELHRLGHAHSYECWRSGRLAGGLYGVRVGGVFCGESMFSAEANASKAALALLALRADAFGIALIDCQVPSAHLRSLGSRPIPRAEFLRALGPGSDVAPAPQPTRSAAG